MLIAQGYSEEYGARHLERTVERLISKPLAELILADKAAAGSHILCNEQDGRIFMQHSAGSR